MEDEKIRRRGPTTPPGHGAPAKAVDWKSKNSPTPRRQGNPGKEGKRVIFPVASPLAGGGGGAVALGFLFFGKNP